MSSYLFIGLKVKVPNGALLPGLGVPTLLRLVGLLQLHQRRLLRAVHPSAALHSHRGNYRGPSFCIRVFWSFTDSEFQKARDRFSGGLDTDLILLKSNLDPVFLGVGSR